MDRQAAARSRRPESRSSLAARAIGYERQSGSASSNDRKRAAKRIRRLEQKEDVSVSNRKWAARVAVTAAGVFVVATAQAQGTYPSKPVRFINPVAAGGNQDIVSRVIA